MQNIHLSEVYYIQPKIHNCNKRVGEELCGIQERSIPLLILIPPTPQFYKALATDLLVRLLVN